MVVLKGKLFRVYICLGAISALTANIHCLSVLFILHRIAESLKPIPKGLTTYINIFADQVHRSIATLFLFQENNAHHHTEKIFQECVEE